MPLDDILNLIKEEAEQSGQNIIKKAKIEAQNNAASAANEAKKQEARLLQDYRTKAEREKERIIDNTKLDIKKMILNKKRSLLSLLYKKAIERFEKLSKEEYLALAKKLIHENTISKNEQLIVSKSEKIINKSFIDSFNKENKGFNLSLSGEKGDFKGGFLMKTDKQQVDCTLEALIVQVREEYEVEITRIYFGEYK